MKRADIRQLEAISFPGYAAPGQPTSHGQRAVELDGAMLSAVQSGKVKLYQGKVRDSFIYDDSILMVTSDRISAFDRILDVIPGKGEILNRISGFWFDKTSDIIDNHIVKTIGGRSLLVKKAQVLPVEVVVRGYLTGSAWRDYQAGQPISGIQLPAGLRLNQRFEQPIITPSTKAEIGDHDEPISSADIVSRGLVSRELWQQVQQAALALFRRGSELVARQGLLLVDTKYEFGICDGKLILVDEIHTPDSSRYWYADGYEDDFQAGREPRKLDKEYLRRWLMDQGFSGEGTAPAIPDDVKAELTWKYISAYQLITGLDFSPFFEHIEAELQKIRSHF